MDAKAGLAKSSLSTRSTSFLSYLRITTHANRVVSALNTNFLIRVDYPDDHDGIRVNSLQVSYTSVSPDNSSSDILSCGVDNPTSIAGFLRIKRDASHLDLSDLDSSDFGDFGFFDSDLLEQWFESTYEMEAIIGFFAGCSPVEALLQSTMDCLYDIGCLQLLSDHFPNLKSVCSELISYSSKNDFSFYRCDGTSVKPSWSHR